MRATRGRVVFASGSPLGSVNWDGRRNLVAQANNAYIFPGLGLAIIVCQIQRVTDSMFLAAADALAGATTPAELRQGAVYPAIARMREVSVAVVRVGYREGLATVLEPTGLREYLHSALCEPAYPTHGEGRGSP